MITVLGPMPGDAEARTPAVFRSGLRAARQELRAGSARRLHTDADPAPLGGSASIEILASDAVARPGGAPATVEPVGPGDPGLATQRAGVRAALEELRQHRGHR